MNRFNYMKYEFISDLKTHERCHLRKKTKHNSVKYIFFFVLFFFFWIFGVCVCVFPPLQGSSVEEPFIKLSAMHNGS